MIKMKIIWTCHIVVLRAFFSQGKHILENVYLDEVGTGCAEDEHTSGVRLSTHNTHPPLPRLV
jgi:hypothetical protein